MKVYAHKMHACEVHADEMHTHEISAHEMTPKKVHANETPAHHCFGGSLAQTVVDLSRSEFQNGSFCGLVQEVAPVAAYCTFLGAD
jgi:hypothetical protein